MSKNILPENWLELFDEAYKEAHNGSFIGPYPSGVRLASVSKLGLPSVRMVLLKSYDKRGFVIYTNMQSKKGTDLQENPYASLCFYWPEIEKEIIVKGKIEMISDADSDDYFHSRPFFSKIGAHASKQSYVIKYKSQFLLRIIFYAAKYVLKKEVDRPSYWKGFRVIPDKMEFISLKQRKES